jgi:CheY-like chemotaxis protein
VIGIILTGANEDGAAGLAPIKARGGVALIQDPPGAERADDAGRGDRRDRGRRVLPLEEIGKFLYGLCGRPRRGEPDGQRPPRRRPPENLLALEAILEPLEQNALYASSGEDALRQLLRHEVAVILLDVQMPELDGFETREADQAAGADEARSDHLRHRDLEGRRSTSSAAIRAGAVDYVFKPFSPEVLRSKVAVFIDLHEKNEQLSSKPSTEGTRSSPSCAARARSATGSSPRCSRTRYGRLSRPEHSTTCNQRVLDYLGTSFAEQVVEGWPRAIHPDDLPRHC